MKNYHLLSALLLLTVSISVHPGNPVKKAIEKKRQPTKPSRANKTFDGRVASTVENLKRIYPGERFDSTVTGLQRTVDASHQNTANKVFAQSVLTTLRKQGLVID